MIGIYKITNKANGKIYVGQSIDIEERWKQHRWKAFNCNEVGYRSAIHAAMRKYGLDNFDYEVLELCAAEELDEKERYWISLLDCIIPNGYNILSGGQKYRKSVKTDCEDGKVLVTKEKTCLVCKKCGKEITKGSASGMCHSCAQLKCDISKEELQNALVQNNGNFTLVGRIYGLSDNAIRKRCQHFGLSFHSTDYKAPKILKEPYETPVEQLDPKTNEIIQVFCSANEAARSLGKAKGNHITEVCRGKGKTAHGYAWRYANK